MCTRLLLRHCHSIICLTHPSPMQLNKMSNAVASGPLGEISFFVNADHCRTSTSQAVLASGQSRLGLRS